MPEATRLVRDAPLAAPRAAADADAYAASVVATAASGAAASSSSAGGLAPSLAHGSSNSTRHLPSSPCCSARRARNERPLRPLKPVTGFKGRSGRSFRAKLALQQGEDGKWRVEFDEPWAKEGRAAEPVPAAEPSDDAAQSAAA